jgi:hypothetical protein
MTMPVSPEGYAPQPHESMEIAETPVGPDYLRAMEIPLVAGRDFSPQDTDTSRAVAIVNQKFIDRYWPHQDALGKRVHADGVWFRVIGVAHNSNYYSPNETPQPFLYLPILQDYSSSTTIRYLCTMSPL